MKNLMVVLLLFLSAGNMFAGKVGLPVEHIAVPALGGDLLLYAWDDAAQAWIQLAAPYDPASGSIDFQVPARGRWYWVGLWDLQQDRFVFGTWVGHF